MIKIPIKIKRDTNSPLAGQEIKKRANLQIKPKTKFSQLWLIFFLMGILLLALIIFPASKNKKISLSFLEIIPDETPFFAFIKIDDLLSSQNLLLKTPSSQQFFLEITNFLKKINLDLEKDIKPLYQEKIALLLSVNKDYLDFVILIKRKENQNGKEEEVLTKIEKELKKDFNFSQFFYRQIKITNLKPVFVSSPGNYYYSQIQEYLIISNSESWLEKIIDLIIGI